MALYDKKVYLKDSRIIKSTIIREYDLRQANINSLLMYEKITKEEYDYLARLPKFDREQYIGKLIGSDLSDIKDPNSIFNTIQRGIVQAKKLLFEKNSIQDEEVIRIANDAVYVARSLPLKYTSFGNHTFALKNTYTLFIRIMGMSFFFNPSDESGGVKLDVVGMSDTALELHSMGMASFIAQIFYYIESSLIQQAIQYLNRFYDDYINKRLPIYFYREFNGNSSYRIIGGRTSTLTISNQPNSLDHIDIGFNAALIRELYSILVELYQKDVIRK